MLLLAARVVQPGLQLADGGGAREPRLLLPLAQRLQCLGALLQPLLVGLRRALRRLGAALQLLALRLQLLPKLRRLSSGHTHTVSARNTRARRAHRGSGALEGQQFTLRRL